MQNLRRRSYAWTEESLVLGSRCGDTSNTGQGGQARNKQSIDRPYHKRIERLYQTIQVSDTD